MTVRSDLIADKCWWAESRQLHEDTIIELRHRLARHTDEPQPCAATVGGYESLIEEHELMRDLAQRQVDALVQRLSALDVT